MRFPNMGKKKPVIKVNSHQEEIAEINEEVFNTRNWEKIPEIKCLMGRGKYER